MRPHDKTEKTASTAQTYRSGDVLSDGWVFMGVSPRTGVPYSVEPESSALKDLRTWAEGEAHAQELRDSGHQNARQPYETELSFIYNVAAKLGLNHNAKFSLGDNKAFFSADRAKDARLSAKSAYWGAATNKFNEAAWCMLFDAGILDVAYFSSRHPEANIPNKARVRCVRDEPHLRAV